MTIIKGDPTYIENKDRYFINVAQAVCLGSTHPLVPGGCIIARGREILGEGRSVLASCKIEIDCITHAIATASKRGTPLAGATVYTTRYPFSSSVFQLHIMGINKIVVVSHEWEAYYKDEFRRAARLARELGTSIEPFYESKDQRFYTDKNAINTEEEFSNKDLYTINPIDQLDFDPNECQEENESDTDI